MSKVIAIIPARSGSKGLVHKNIKKLNGIPLMCYTIEAAISSKMFDEIHVSTDSEEYANIAKSCGVSVPFLRSVEVSRDETSTLDTVRWILSQYENQAQSFDVVMILQPTSPFRNAEDIINAHSIYVEKKADSVVSVVECVSSPLWTNTLPHNHSLHNFIADDVKNTPRQKLETYYELNGAIYILKKDMISVSDDFFNENSFAYVMSREHSIDVDTISDFEYAEYLLSHKLPEFR